MSDTYCEKHHIRFFDVSQNVHAPEQYLCVLCERDKLRAALEGLQCEQIDSLMEQPADTIKAVCVEIARAAKLGAHLYLSSPTSAEERVVKKWTAGHGYSTSRNCGYITFRGGPMDGERGLYDTNDIAGVSFCDSLEKVTHTYRPERHRSWTFIYEGPHYWCHGSSLTGDPINGWRRHFPHSAALSGKSTKE